MWRGGWVVTLWVADAADTLTLNSPQRREPVSTLAGNSQVACHDVFAALKAVVEADFASKGRMETAGVASRYRLPPIKSEMPRKERRPGSTRSSNRSTTVDVTMSVKRRGSIDMSVGSKGSPPKYGGIPKNTRTCFTGSQQGSPLSGSPSSAVGSPSGYGLGLKRVNSLHNLTSFSGNLNSSESDWTSSSNARAAQGNKTNCDALANSMDLLWNDYDDDE
ncbi:hypothetical protein CYMTET_47998 [Cymbomonas tetramitiformis]|uniref:Uncharacterized protein n=1 Tax=Cymbomonas tetramitiformis TaxID=36881 RepID=A0AAE0BUX5_9CHLO|nr:hypothetical protein CYMTET_47998 [Cymbomonas tetramitiformis]